MLLQRRLYLLSYQRPIVLLPSEEGTLREQIQRRVKFLLQVLLLITYLRYLPPVDGNRQGLQPLIQRMVILPIMQILFLPCLLQRLHL